MCINIQKRYLGRSKYEKNEKVCSADAFSSLHDIFGCLRKRAEIRCSGGKQQFRGIRCGDRDGLLSRKKIGVQTGTTGDIYATDYEGDEAGTVVERYNKGVDAVMSLKQGKIDCVIIDNEPAKVFVSENDDLKILDEPFAEEEYAICVDKSNSELKDKINQALTDLKADGTLDEIIGHRIGDSADQKSYESAADADHSNGTLVMATNAEFPPYESLDGENVVGIDADIARAIADKLGMGSEN